MSASRSTQITRRSFLGGTAAAGISALLASCSAPGPTSSPSQLVVWHNYTQDTRVAFMEKAAAAFEKLHPGLKVTVEVVPNAQFNTRWPAAQTAGTLPDVTTLLPENAVNMSLAGALHPLDDVLADLGGADAFQPNLIRKLATFRDEVILLPHYVHNRLLIHRKDFLSEANVTLPERPTWSEAFDAAVAMQKPPTRFGWVLRLSQSDTGGGYLLYMMTRSAGGHLFDEAGKSMLTTPEVRRATDYIAEIARAASTPAQTGYAIADTFSLMESGTTGFAEDSAALIGNTVLQSPTTASQLGSTFMPTDKQTGNLIGSFGWATPKGRNHALAKEFVKFMYSAEMYVPFLKTIPLFMFPALAAVDEKSFYSDATISAFRATADQTRAGIKEGDAPGFEFGPNAFSGTVFSSHVLEDVLQNVIVNGASSAEALRAADDRLNALLAEVAARA